MHWRIVYYQYDLSWQIFLFSKDINIRNKFSKQITCHPSAIMITIINRRALCEMFLRTEGVFAFPIHINGKRCEPKHCCTPIIQLFFVCLFQNQERIFPVFMQHLKINPGSISIKYFISCVGFGKIFKFRFKHTYSVWINQ